MRFKQRKKKRDSIEDIQTHIKDVVKKSAIKEDTEQVAEEPQIENKKPDETHQKTNVSIDLEQLKERIEENDKYFSSLIDFIPARIYFEGNEEILESMQKQKRNVFGDDMDLSKRSKQKRFKLDPNSDQKISEIANSFYNRSSKKNNSKDDKMAELKRKLNQKIIQLKSKRGQKSNARQLREPKKERKKLNSMRASKQKGFSKRPLLESTADDNKPESKPKKSKTEDSTDSPKIPKNMPKIYNKEGNIVYSKFDLITPSKEPFDKNRKNKKNKLQKLLVKTKKEEQKLSELEVRDAPKAQEIKEKKLWRKAIDLSEGIKVKDKSKLIEKTINRKKKLKQKSAKKWSERKESLEKSMKSKDDKRKKNINERKQQKKDKKFKRLKKRGVILDNK